MLYCNTIVVNNVLNIMLATTAVYLHVVAVEHVLHHATRAGPSIPQRLPPAGR
jgi:hypothetical protein